MNWLKWVVRFGVAYNHCNQRAACQLFSRLSCQHVRRHTHTHTHTSYAIDAFGA